VIVDICLRMLTPRELANATSFPPQHIIERGHDGRMFSKSKQVAMIGNAVPPLLQRAVTAANYFDYDMRRAA
jgi:DNA (cytosine-5)-methyltransferase 1